MIETDFSNKPLKALPTGHCAAGAAQIVINDFNVAPWPT
jgi:hypothetical protein